MLRIRLIFVFIICTNTHANAQKTNGVENTGSFTGAIGSSFFSAALGYQHLWKLGKKQKLGIGGGARFTSYFGSNQYYTTAPAQLTSGQTGPGVLFADDIIENIDSVLFKTSQVNALNLSINFAYDISRKFSVGFNIDAIGFSFGAQQKAIYYGNNGIGFSTTAKPTGFNLLLVSDNDKGTLNSELYLRYLFNNKWGAKVGFQYLFTEYTAETKVQTASDGQQNDRFRKKSSGISLGVTRAL